MTINRTTNGKVIKIDDVNGIIIPDDRRSEEGDQTHAVIAACVKFNTELKRTQVLMVDHHENGNTTRRLTAGSSCETETVNQTLHRKLNFLTGLKPLQVVYISTFTKPSSSKDPQRMNEEHTKFGAIVLEFTGEIIKNPPIGGETSAPYWVDIKYPGNLFRNHKEHLEGVMAYLKKHYRNIYLDL